MDLSNFYQMDEACTKRAQEKEQKMDKNTANDPDKIISLTAMVSSQTELPIIIHLS